MFELNFQSKDFLESLDICRSSDYHNDIWSVKVHPRCLFKNETIRLEMPDTSFIDVIYIIFIFDIIFIIWIRFSLYCKIETKTLSEMRRM